MPRPRLTYANVASTVALVLALGGTAWAAALPRNSVGARQLKRGAVTNTKLATNSVSTAKIRLGAVTTGRIAVHGVDSSRIKDDAISARKIADGSIGAEDLSPQALAAAAPLLYRIANPTIQIVGFDQVQVATLHIDQPGTYLMTVELRAFPTTSGGATPGHNLNCAVNGVGGSPPSVTNATIPTQTGVSMITITGTGVVGDQPADAVVNCRQIVGTGQITLSYKWTAIRVTTPA
jgi:hypothetical protein